jgi:hypothetical protein
MTTSLPGAHVIPAQVSGYAAGRLSAAEESSFEEHLMSCAACRRLVSSGGRVDDRRLAAVWSEVVDVLDQPRVPMVERVLHRLGVGPETARLVAAAPSLRVPWLTAVATCLLLAVIAAGEGGVRGQWLFLAVAPLLPVAGVAAAYGPRWDSAWELARATQYSLSRLALLRSLAVLGSTLPLAAVVGVALPDADWWLAAVWLLPSLAFVTLTLWAATYVEPLLAVGVLTVGWLAVTSSATVHRTDPDLLWQPAVQFGFAAVMVAAAAGLWVRRGELATPRWQA